MILLHVRFRYMYDSLSFTAIDYYKRGYATQTNVGGETYPAEYANF